MDLLPSEYIKVSYFWPKSAKKSFCLWRVSKKRKKIEKNFEKNLKFFFHKNISKYNIWIVPTFGVPQITLEGSRDQNLRGGHWVPPPYKVGLKVQKCLILTSYVLVSQYNSKGFDTFMVEMNWFTTTERSNFTNMILSREEVILHIIMARTHITMG